MSTDSLRKRVVWPFSLLVTLIGAVACVLSIFELRPDRFDGRFLVLSILTICFGSRLTLQIPRAKVHLSLSDAFLFLIMLLFGGGAAVLVAAAEALLTSLRFRRTGINIRLDGILFNCALMATSTFLTVWTLRLMFGPITELVTAHPAVFITAICVMALVQYAANSVLAAIYTAYETDQPIWETWNTHYFPTSFTYFVGAVIAGTLVRLVSDTSFYVVLAITPITAIAYLTFRRHINDIKSSAAQAELAEHARAEAEAERAEQAERHVAELNHYISELERTGAALQESREHFRHAAFHDSLTGLPNRNLFSDQLRLAIEECKQHRERSFAVLFLDLDRFKNINDSLGHSQGDQLLVEIAARLRGCIGPAATVARFGGDEFAILMDRLKDPAEALQLAEKIQQDLSAPFTIGKSEAVTTASIGIAFSGLGYERPEDILRDADTAMYRAKDAGKARYEVFDTAMHDRAVIRMRMENDLRRAIEQQEFRVYYQPIVSLTSRKLAGFEALVRWQHPERGIISPTEFIPMAEETGMIVPIGQWVLEQSCKLMRGWHRQSPLNRALVLNVNISGKQLQHPELIEQINRAVTASGLQPGSLKLEITESVLMENAEGAATTLARLREHGYRLCIDDFGTGYSSLSYLHNFPVNTLKIDRSFVERIGLDGGNEEITQTIVQLAHNLGMEVVAEGVETYEQLSQLAAMGCQLGQGYVFSKPLDAEAATAYIVAGHNTSLGTVPLNHHGSETDITPDGLVM
jgi:diguanylate cyclase (GGDEF)-like protein